MQYALYLMFRSLNCSYKHAIDGLVQVCRKEGAVCLFNGVSMTATRAMFMTFGQLAFYDAFKNIMISSGYFRDNPVTHFSASIGAAGIATCMTQPFDVMKTRLMNAPPGKYSVSMHFVMHDFLVICRPIYLIFLMYYV